MDGNEPGRGTGQYHKKTDATGDANIAPIYRKGNTSKGGTYH